MSAPTPSTNPSDCEEAAVPTLKVMRLQSPDLDVPPAGSLESRCLLGSSMSLPDSFGVIHVGETFTAYLGAINVSNVYFVRRLNVTAQLQTPSHRWPLPSSLDATLGVDVSPGDGVDAIVSRALEEPGQHILRVEVGYLTSEGTNKTLRKFYRFNVTNPLNIRELTVRSGDGCCFVSIAVENVSGIPMVISNAIFEAANGFVGNRIGGTSPTQEPLIATSASLIDACGRLPPKSSFRYVFQIKTAGEAAFLKGIACGDILGKAVLEWTKTMGEAGRIASSPITCPVTQPPGIDEKNPTKLMMGTGNRFVVDGSGLSVDVAAAAANRAAGKVHADLDQALPITVEPVDPPKTMGLAQTEEVQFLVVNHSDVTRNVQLQFRLNHMSGVAVCGTSFKNLGKLAGSGGSVLVGIRLIALVGGLLRVQGCCVVDLESGQEIPQPPLFHMFVDGTSPQQ
jgi:trafficking protein particle complex subunit 13